MRSCRPSSAAICDPEDSGRHIQSTLADVDRRGQLIPTGSPPGSAAQVAAGCGRHNSRVRRLLYKRRGGRWAVSGRDYEGGWGRAERGSGRL